jgi:hypothetical protein
MDKKRFRVVDTTSYSKDLEDTLNEYWEDQYTPIEIFQRSFNDSGHGMEYSYRIVFQQMKENEDE